MSPREPEGDYARELAAAVERAVAPLLAQIAEGKVRIRTLEVQAVRAKDLADFVLDLWACGTCAGLFPRLPKLPDGRGPERGRDALRLVRDGGRCWPAHRRALLVVAEAAVGLFGALVYDASPHRHSDAARALGAALSKAGVA